jgi:hypothetical protein
MRNVMTDLQFNDLLGVEMAEVALHYVLQPHFQPYAYVMVCGETAPGIVIRHQEGINPGDKGLVELMRRLGSKYGFTQPRLDPTAIFVVNPATGIDMSGQYKGEREVLLVNGITSDGRFNVGILEQQRDEDGRLYYQAIEVHPWADPMSFQMSVLEFMQFFEANEQARVGSTV